MTAGQPPNRLTAQGLIGLMGLFAGLCALLALVVTVGEAWRERTQAGWPQAAARIQRCSVDEREGFRGDSPRYTAHIECRISYVTGAEEVVTRVRSRSIPAPHPGYWQYPPANLGLLQEWVDDHPSGSTIVVNYDPENHKNAVLIATAMPYSGPRTPSNLRLLAIATVACVVLLTIARLLRPHPESNSPPAAA